MASEKKDSGDNGGSPVTAGDGNSSGEAQQATPPLQVVAQYTPSIFEKMQEHNPQITINIDVNVQPIDEEKKVFEVILNCRAECKVEDTIAFILELSYGGVFALNVPDEHLEPALLVECPRLLFPFARNIMAETTRDGGFPPLMLGPVDFVSMYQGQLAQRQAQAEAGETPPSIN
jgi:preprotein translocase subunit SecB